MVCSPYQYLSLKVQMLSGQKTTKKKMMKQIVLVMPSLCGVRKSRRSQKCICKSPDLLSGGYWILMQAMDIVI